MSFRVVHPGTFGILVDSGRPAHRSLGIPVGGAADRAAWQIGNALLDNPPDAPALEITLSGPKLLALADVDVAIFGAPFRIEVDGAPLPPASTIPVRAGQLLTIGATPRGARAYLTVAGGFAPAAVLNSRSAFAPIEAEQVLSASGLPARRRSLQYCEARALLEIEAEPDVIRVVAGAQADWFPASGFFETPFQVATAANRMGIRLAGPAIHRPAGEMVSEAVAPGAVQVTNEGQCIILGVDGQTIGGYPKIAHAIRADLDRLAQLRPGQTIRFRRVALEEAEEIAEHQESRLTGWLRRLAL